MPRTKIPTINHEIDIKVHHKLEAHDKIMKDKTEKYFDNRYHTKNRQMHVGDYVLDKQPKMNKPTPPWIPILILLNALRKAW